MPEFDAEAYKQRLDASSSCTECEKVPLPKLGEKERYIFISYSHKDYKQVYADLAELYAADVPFWYDSGLPAGKNWDDEVRDKMTDPRCAGVIFYLSENLFLSNSIQIEIHIACGDDEASQEGRPYFCVNLAKDTPFDLLRSALTKKPFSDAEDKMQAQLNWFTTLTNAFPEKVTYLNYGIPYHTEDLLRQIRKVFGIDPNSDAFSFEDALFRSGNGVIEFPNGAVYDGAFANGVLSGRGEMSYPNGTHYKGDWANGMKNGYGMMVYSDHSIYEGDWLDGKRHGQGTHTRADGSEYEGEWANNRPHGRGTMSFPDGASYSGFWVYGKRHGQGTMVYPDGTRYEGEWKDNKQHGSGTRTYTDGSVYAGKWMAGKLHGFGILTLPDGTKQSKHFDNGKLIGPK